MRPFLAQDVEIFQPQRGSSLARHSLIKPRRYDQDHAIRRQINSDQSQITAVIVKYTPEGTAPNI